MNSPWSRIKTGCKSQASLRLAASLKSFWFSVDHSGSVWTRTGCCTANTREEHQLLPAQWQQTGMCPHCWSRCALLWAPPGWSTGRCGSLWTKITSSKVPAVSPEATHYWLGGSAGMKVKLVFVFTTRLWLVKLSPFPSRSQSPFHTTTIHPPSVRPLTVQAGECFTTEMNSIRLLLHLDALF